MLACVALLPGRAAAIQLSAVYSASCQREVGVILAADGATIKLLSVDGRIRVIQRFNIIYLAHYSLCRIPIPHVLNPEEVDVLTIRTRHQGQIAELVRGWLIDHSEEAFSFLALNGEEVVVGRDDIWDIEAGTAKGPVRLPGGSAHHRFVHPYPFRHCNGAKQEPSAESETTAVYPQQLLADPLLIKNALDHLLEGHERLEAYLSSKVFYPAPQLYSNQTRLGLGLTAGSRHGVSSTRNNSLVPVLYDELSEGPFGFQRIWVAGSAPMPYSVHEEPQTQVYYRLKSDFVHFSAMYDLSRALIGESQYKWQAHELDRKDDRVNEIFHVAGGVDYAPFAIDISDTSLQYGIRYRDQFFFNRVEMAKFGIFYHDHGLKAEYHYGLASDAKPGVSEISEGNDEEAISEAQLELAKIPEYSTVLALHRINLAFTEWGAGRFSYSLIYRTIDFQRDADADGEGRFKYASDSLSNGLYWKHALENDMGLSGFVSLENVANKAGLTQLGNSTRHAFFKGGISIELKL